MQFESMWKLSGVVTVKAREGTTKGRAWAMYSAKVLLLGLAVEVDLGFGDDGKKLYQKLVSEFKGLESGPAELTGKFDTKSGDGGHSYVKLVALTAKAVPA